MKQVEAKQVAGRQKWRGWSRTRGGNTLRVNSGGCLSPGAGELSTAGVRVETWGTLLTPGKHLSGNCISLAQEVLLALPPAQEAELCPCAQGWAGFHATFSLFLQSLSSGCFWRCLGALVDLSSYSKSFLQFISLKIPGVFIYVATVLLK